MDNKNEEKITDAFLRELEKASEKLQIRKGKKRLAIEGSAANSEKDQEQVLSTLEEWRKTSRRAQNSFYDRLGDRTWDSIKKEFLKQKLYIGFFGCSNEIVSNTPVYNKNQDEIVQKIYNKILSLLSTEHIKIAFIYIMFREKGRKGKQDIQPLCKICTDSNSEVFIDPECRVYKSFEGYLQHNKLPQSDICFPNHGKYYQDDGIVDLKFAESQSCKVSSTIFKGLDITSTILTIGATGVTVASLAFPIMTPFVLGSFGTLAASGVYDIGRSTYKLYDIKNHSGSLSFTNRDSRDAWLSMAGSAASIVTVGTSAVIRGTIRTGSALERSTLIALRAFNVSSVAIYGCGVVNSLISVVIKFIDKTLTKTDIINFIQVVFFFLNTVVTYVVAERVISEIANENPENLLRLSRNSTYKVTKAMLEYKDTSNYLMFKNLLLGLCPQSSSKIFFFEDFSKIILEFVNNLCAEKIDKVKLFKQALQILNTIWNQFKETMIQAMEEIIDVLPTKKWQSTFIQESISHKSCTSPNCAKQVLSIAYQTAKECDQNINVNKSRDEIIQSANDFNAVVPGKNELEYVQRFRYACQNIHKQYSLVKQEYETKLDSESSVKGFNHSLFDQNYGIRGTRSEFFFKKTLETVNTQHNLCEMMANYYRDVALETAVPSADMKFIDCSISSLFTFCGPIGQKELTEEEYLDNVRTLTEIDVNGENSKIMKETNVIFIQPITNQEYKAMFIYNVYVEEKDILVCLLLLMKNNG